MKAVVLALALISTLVVAHEHPAPTMPKEFDTLKGMVGTWEAVATKDGKEEKITVVYELTSNGTALTEKINAGKPDEMISVYHKEGKTLGMTHYCALGNQPHMKLKKASDNSMAFEMVGTTGIQSPSHDMLPVTLSAHDCSTSELLRTL